MAELILGTFVVLMASLYVLSIFFIVKERLMNPLVRFFCINNSSLKEMRNSSGVLRKEIKTIIIVSMILHLIMLLTGSIVVLIESSSSFWIFLLMSYLIRFAAFMLVHHTVKISQETK